MTIEKNISELLTDQDCVIVSGFGGFIAKYIPAGIHPVTHVFTPPSRQVAFNSSLKNNDGLLANQLVQSLKISYAEALTAIEKQTLEWTILLNKGEKINIQNIGIIFTDSERNIQFIPEHNTNLLDDAFGLATFSSQPVDQMGNQHKGTRIRVKSNVIPSARKLPASIKWAAVLLPLAALSFWGAFNTDKIIRFNTKQTAVVLPLAAEKPVANAVNPFLVSIPEIKKETEIFSDVPVAYTFVEPAATPIAETKVEAENYFIIAGAFAVKANADKLVEKLKKLGYDSSIAGQNSKGLYRVSIEGFAEKETALEKTEEFRKGDFPGAWLLSLR